jgi:two-component system NarL family sensor kinase
MRKRFLGILLGICIPTLLWAQNATIDSLQHHLKEAKGLERGMVYFELAVEAQKNEAQEAADYAWKAADIAQEYNDPELLANAWHRYALNNYSLGNYEEALEYYQKSLDLFIDQDDNSKASLVVNLIGHLVKKQGDLDKSLGYFEQGLELSRAAADTSGMGNSLNNMGIVYQVKQQYAKAMQLFEESTRLKATQHDINGLSYNYDNMGMTAALMGNYDQAVSYYERAIELRTQVGDQRMNAILYNNMGEVLKMKGDLSAAIPYFETALAMARESNYPDLQQYVLRMLAEAHRTLNNFESALTYFQDHAALKDSLFTVARSRQLAEMETKYQTEKKEQQIQIQQAALERNFAIIIGLVIVLALVFLIWGLVRKQTQRKMELRLREAQIGAALTSQESERKRFAQDLHDSLGQLISACRLQIGQLTDPTPSTSPVKIAEQSERVLDEMHSEIRNITFNLMPSTLIQNGLVDGTKELAMRLNQNGEIRFNVTSFGFDERMPEQQEVALYRIIQEWTSNVMKYSDASKVDIQLLMHEDELVVTMEDDGSGFNTSHLTESSGNGWKNMQSRLGMFDGSIDVDSTPGVKGTTVIVQVPRVVESEETRSLTAVG